jgi:hypothetical protein
MVADLPRSGSRVSSELPESFGAATLVSIAERRHAKPGVHQNPWKPPTPAQGRQIRCGCRGARPLSMFRVHSRARHRSTKWQQQAAPPGCWRPHHHKIRCQRSEQVITFSSGSWDETVVGSPSALYRRGRKAVAVQVHPVYLLVGQLSWLTKFCRCWGCQWGNSPARRLVTGPDRRSRELYCHRGLLLSPSPLNLILSTKWRVTLARTDGMLLVIQSIAWAVASSAQPTQAPADTLKHIPATQACSRDLQAANGLVSCRSCDYDRRSLSSI